MKKEEKKEKSQLDNLELDKLFEIISKSPNMMSQLDEKDIKKIIKKD